MTHLHCSKKVLQIQNVNIAAHWPSPLLGWKGISCDRHVLNITSKWKINQVMPVCIIPHQSCVFLLYFYCLIILRYQYFFIGFVLKHRQFHTGGSSPDCGST